MIRSAAILLGFAFAILAADDPVVFKSDVAMTRVDAQVVDAMDKPIIGLQAKDFVLRVDGKPQPIRNFASENMPVDILLLLDVSGSMQPHVQRITDASECALRVLAPEDRVAIMVFDSRSRLRLPFRLDHGEVIGELHRLLQSESFNGGTRVTHALLDAARYVQREGRPDARHAIVILTDDQTQDGEAETRVRQALDEANAVLSFLRAPYEQPFVQGRGRTRSPGTWGGGGPIGGGGPWGRPGRTWPGTTWPDGGSRLPGGVTLGQGDRSHSAGTAEIAEDSGGDVIPVEGASAFEDTLARLRQRYALHFYWPERSTNPEQRLVTVALARFAGTEYPNAEVRYRRAYISKRSGRNSGSLAEVSREADPTDPEGTTRVTAESQDTSAAPNSAQGARKRRVAVNDGSTAGPNLIDYDGTSSSDPQSSSSAQNQATKSTTQSAPDKRGGWPRVDENSPHQ